MRNNWTTITRKQKLGKKQLYGRFKRLISNISHEKIWTWLRKGNFKRETSSLLTAAPKKAIRTNHIKVIIDKTQQNSKCKISGEREENIKHIINECSKLAQKDYKTRHKWVGKIIHWELCNKFKFDHYEQMIYAQPGDLRRLVIQTSVKDHQLTLMWKTL